MFYDRQKAIIAYERALKLTQLGIGEIPLADIELHIAIARAELDFADRKAARKLRSRLAALDAETAVSESAARGWTAITLHEIEVEEFISAKESARSAVRAAANLEPNARTNRLLAKALIYGAIARVAGKRATRTETNVMEAAEMLDRAVPLFPPPRDIDSFDRILALAISWRASISSLVESFRTNPSGLAADGADLSQALEYQSAKTRFELQNWIAWQIARPPDCKLSWIARLPPQFPQGALQDGIIGSTIIGYDVDDTGVTRTVVLAEPVGSGFGRSAAASMQLWKLGSPPPESCKRNNILIVSYQTM